MDKSLIHSIVCFPSQSQSSISGDPGDRSLNLPPMLTAAETASILNFRGSKVTRRSNQFDATTSKIRSQGIGIIGFITNQTVRFSGQPFQSFLNQYLLVRSGRVKGHCQRNSLAVCHHHELRTLSTPCKFDLRAPFFATTKWPSIKHCAHWIFRFLSSSRMKLSQIFSQTPCSSQSLRRLQQVLGLGYSLGKSFHRAPLRKTQRIPSKTNRLFLQGRPLLFSLGSNGSIFFHCFSLKYIARLIGLPPMNPLSANQL